MAVDACKHRLQCVLVQVQLVDNTSLLPELESITTAPPEIHSLLFFVRLLWHSQRLLRLLLFFLFLFIPFSLFAWRRLHLLWRLAGRAATLLFSFCPFSSSFFFLVKGRGDRFECTYKNVEYCKKECPDIDGEYFWNYYEQTEWIKANGQKIINWKSTIKTWNKRKEKESVKTDNRVWLGK